MPAAAAAARVSPSLHQVLKTTRKAAAARKAEPAEPEVKLRTAFPRQEWEFLASQVAEPAETPEEEQRCLVLQGAEMAALVVMLRQTGQPILAVVAEAAVEMEQQVARVVQVTQQLLIGVNYGTTLRIS